MAEPHPFSPLNDKKSLDPTMAVSRTDPSSSNADGKTAHGARKKKYHSERKKSGSLPLVMFLSMEEASARPDCIHASNPFHKCGRHCFANDPGAKKSTTSATTEDGKKIEKVEAKKEVNPSCSNASNPYHKCTKSCIRKIAGNGVVSVSKERHSVAAQEKGYVNPTCHYSSNPFHVCAESCLQRNIGNDRAKGTIATTNERKDVIKTEDGISSQLNKCKNSSNPFHNCAEYCNGKIPEKVRAKGKRTAALKEERKKANDITEKENAQSKGTDVSYPCDQEFIEYSFQIATEEALADRGQSDQNNEEVSIDAFRFQTCTEIMPEMYQDVEENLSGRPALRPELIFILLYVTHLVMIKILYSEK